MTTLLEFLKPSATLRFIIVLVLGILFCIIGVTGIILSVIELFQGRPSVAHYNDNQGGLKVENPLWPSAGKGFWVGLILLTTGLVGVLASRERTPPALVGFTALASVSTVLSFYLIITCIIPVQYDTKYSDASRSHWQLMELTLNSLLIAVGGAGTIIGAIATLFGSFLAGYCVDQRDVYRYSFDIHDKIRIVRPEEY